MSYYEDPYCRSTTTYSITLAAHSGGRVSFSYDDVIFDVVQVRRQAVPGTKVRFGGGSCRPTAVRFWSKSGQAIEIRGAGITAVAGAGYREIIFTVESLTVKLSVAGRVEEPRVTRVAEYIKL